MQKPYFLHIILTFPVLSEKIVRDLSIMEPAVLLYDNNLNLVNRENTPEHRDNNNQNEDFQHVAGYNCGNPEHADGRSLNMHDIYEFSQNDFYDGYYDFSGDLDGRIVGGGESAQNEYPWQVFLQTCYCNSKSNCDSSNNMCANCGGSVISGEWILTAAHCVDLDLNNGNGVYLNNPTYAVVGTNDKTDVKCQSYTDAFGTFRTICENVLWYQNVIYHENWDDSGNELTYGVDIAVIKFSPSDPNFQFSTKTVIPVCLPSADLCLEG